MNKFNQEILDWITRYQYGKSVIYPVRVAEAVREKFGVPKEFCYALNNSRLLRNIKSVHKTRPMRYDIPFLVVLGSAYLIIMFLEMTIATGVIFTNPVSIPAKATEDDPDQSASASPGPGSSKTP